MNIELSKFDDVINHFCTYPTISILTDDIVEDLRSKWYEMSVNGHNANNVFDSISALLHEGFEWEDVVNIAYKSSKLSDVGKPNKL